MELFDTHAHYNDEKFELDRQEVIQAIYNSGVTSLVNAGYSLDSSKKAIEIARNYDWMYVTCGISPNDILNTNSEIDLQIVQLEKLIKDNLYCDFNLEANTNEKLEQSLQNKKNDIVENVDNNSINLKKAGVKSKKRKIVAVGEIGLDYYWNKENKELQKYAFKKQIELANRLQLPIVIHTREAVDDTLSILRNESLSLKKGIFHCCPLNRELVKQGLDLGFYISCAGPITFKNSKNADEIISMVPLNRILIETDSPYLSPEPNRGKRNDSRNVHFIAEKIAKVRNLNVEEVAFQTYKNAEKIFEIN